MNPQTCAQFNSKGQGCKNPAQPVSPGSPFLLDFCAMHNHMAASGIPLKCWRCGDK